MHIPSSMIEGAICPVTAGVSIIAIGAASYFAYKSDKKPSIKYFAAITGLIFILQMLNYPIGGGVSGHVLGAVLAVALLGMPFGILSMSLVIAVQAVFFGDGGISIMGANILNMALVGCSFGWIAQKISNKKASPIAYGIAAYLSVITASIVLSLEFAIAGSADLSRMLYPMVGIHAIIAIGEAVVTAGLVLILSAEVNYSTFRKAVSIPLLVALFIGLLLAPFASDDPDGFEFAEWIANHSDNY